MVVMVVVVVVVVVEGIIITIFPVLALFSNGRKKNSSQHYQKKRKKIPGIDGEKVIGGSYEEPTLPQHSPFSSKSPSPITFENKTTKKKHVLIRQPSISDPHLRKKVPPELLQRNNRAHRPRSPSHNSAPISSSGTVYPPVDRNKINPSTHHSFSFLASASSSQIRFLLEKMVDKLEGEERNLLVATLVILHGHPIELFEECLREESTKEPRVETLMRLTSPSVVVLSAITKPFLSSLLDLATPLIELAHTLTQKDIDSLLPFNTPSPPLSPAFSPTLSATSPHRNFQLPSPPSSFTSSFNSSTESVGSSYFSCSSPTPPPTMNSPPLNSLSSNLFNCISHLLTPTSFQLFYLFHILCFRASHVVSNTIGGEDDKNSQWATTSILFLRFLIPSIISSSSPSSSSSSSSSSSFSSSSTSPGPRFVGKFLMKMCTNSTFAPFSSGCPADTLLSSLSPLFSNFCEEMMEIGKKNWEEEKEEEENNARDSTYFSQIGGRACSVGGGTALSRAHFDIKGKL